MSPIPSSTLPEVTIARARATYRVQLHTGFTFDDAAALVPYLSRLGISHLYCSPVLQAAPGSTHGYDVVDPTRLSDDLGGRTAFERLARALAEHDMGMVVDIVPNHMALAGAANRWWWDVLEDGPSSRYARHFDIDWTPVGEGTGPSVLMPVLGDHYGRVLEAGELRLARVGGSFTVSYAEHELPLSPKSVRELLRAAAARAGSADLVAIADRLDALPSADAADLVEERHAGKEALRSDLRALTTTMPAVAEAIDAELASTERDPDALDALLGRQCYRLAHWRTASEELDYRRFFDITTLAGLRAEDPTVFADTHALLLELVGTGDVDGFRVDHIDGLRDPQAYLDRLARSAPSAFLTVEKILAPDESLPETWPVVGTTGYDFLNRALDVLVDPDGYATIDGWYRERTGSEDRFETIAREAKHHVMGHELAAETERVTDLLVRVCHARRRHRDHTRRDLRTALQEVAAGMAVYRTYVVPGHPTSEVDRARVAAAVARARDERADLDTELLDLLEGVLVGDERGEDEDELALRFQQLSAPVMAKGVEDTAFYRDVRFVAANEVGGEPGHVGRGTDPFHRHNQRTAATWPQTMLTLSTHDTKRSADVRARLVVLSEIADAWCAAIDGWREVNERHRRAAEVDLPTELLLYQSLIGAWPIDLDRLHAAMHKSINEAKVRTSWREPNEAYRRAVADFTRAVLEDRAFTGSVEAFIEEHDLVRLGRLTSLSQVALLLTSPGVPDVYQGDELWDLSLVDPDNRRPVDNEQRAKLLEVLADVGAEAALDELASGGTKQWLIHRLLQHRRRRPGLYGEAYDPLVPAGDQAGHVVAFTRGDLLVAVPRLHAGLARRGWGTATLPVPRGRWRDVLAGTDHVGGDVELAALLERFPVAVLERTDG
jgi:(1->4)-alpha-D-glucan 1-alpha-D-glucosylmutase